MNAAHGLKARGVSPESIASFQTASHYTIFNGLTLLLLSLHPRFSVHRFAGPAIAAGTLLFSGSIAALVLNRETFKWLGPVTPLGGVVMIAGYVSLALRVDDASITVGRRHDRRATSPPRCHLLHRFHLHIISLASSKATPLLCTRPQFLRSRRGILQATPLRPTPLSDTCTRAPHRQTPRSPCHPHALSSLGLDPLPSDPNTVFLRHPFASFPNQDSYPEGLTYTALAENPNWFLHPEDYIGAETASPAAVAYPSSLEPPRGWCPARKKDLKEKGSEGWPEGEQPRLRCTFCRRTYAGVNAKSMWRRHVFEKHKIAMSNRRNDMERPRGRVSNKENKHRPVKGVKQKEETHETILDLDGAIEPTAAVSHGESPPKLDASHSPKSPGPSSQMAPPASPYDPLLTPSFRHSPPRLPSDQPWRFPSPSHPLHRSRELSLTMLGGAIDSPVMSSPVPVRGGSRAVTAPLSSSPCIGLETPERPFPRALFSALRVAERISAGSIVNTPQPRIRRRAKTLSAVADSDDWESNILLNRDPDQNPFVATWGGDPDEDSPPSSSPEGGESPVVRSAVPSGAGLGIGLLEPFILPDRCPSANDVDFDELMESQEDGDEAEVLDALTCSQASVESEDLPASKKRRTMSTGGL
ncbi:hypothetical protein C8J57DRAFT_1491056 [Mycena rebaudengoi]|nr:hypothetical protein C8J57DRAFT_1491056 [Mycena rebaudengoi]